MFAHAAVFGCCADRLGIMSHPLHPGGYCYQLLVVLAKPRFNKTLSTHALHIASGMKAPASGASFATLAPGAEETPTDEAVIGAGHG